jgi:coenzyme F420-reducing hydrogenase beta subunit
MRSVKIGRQKGKFIIKVLADGYQREYSCDNVEAAKARACRLCLILDVEYPSSCKNNNCAPKKVKV